MERALIIEYTITEIKSSAGFTKKTPASHPLEITHVCAMKPSRAHNHFIGSVTVRIPTLSLSPDLTTWPTQGDLVTSLPEHGRSAVESGEGGPDILGVIHHNCGLFRVPRIPANLRVFGHHNGPRIVALSRQRVDISSEPTNEAGARRTQTAALSNHANTGRTLEVQTLASKRQCFLRNRTNIGQSQTREAPGALKDVVRTLRFKGIRAGFAEENRLLAHETDSGNRLRV